MESIITRGTTFLIIFLIQPYLPIKMALSLRPTGSGLGISVNEEKVRRLQRRASLAESGLAERGRNDCRVVMRACARREIVSSFPIPESVVSARIPLRRFGGCAMETNGRPTAKFTTMRTLSLQRFGPAFSFCADHSGRRHSKEKQPGSDMYPVFWTPA